MPIDVSVHNILYDKWMQRWSTINDAIEGLHALREKKAQYLPPLSGMLIDDRNFSASYDRYLSGARYYNAGNRTLSLLVGLIARRPVIMNIDNRFETIIKENLNNKGTSIYGIISNICQEMLKYSRACIYVDYVQSPGSNTGRPIIDNIPIQSIINWRERNGEFELLVIKKCQLLPDEKNPFDTISKEIFGVYTLEDNIAYYETYYKNDNGTTISNNDKKVLSIHGKPLDFIPARFISLIEDDKFLITTPPLEPITDHCLSFYRLSADRSWGLHHISLPTPYFTGLNKSQLPQGLGPSIIIGLPAGATAGMLTYTGEGLNEILNEMKEIKLEIADMGARILESRAHAQEAEGTVEMKMTADSASLSTVVEQVSDALTWSIRLFHDYLLSQSNDKSIVINTDFVKSKLKGNELTAIVDAYLKGAIPIETLFENLQEGEIISQEDTVETFTEKLFETQRRQLDEALSVTNKVIPQDDNTDPAI